MRWWWACVHVNVYTCVYMFGCIIYVYLCMCVCVHELAYLCKWAYGNEVIMNTMMELLIKPHQYGRRCTSMVAVQSSLAGHRFPWRLLITHGATP